jgi:hypothetical protein
MNGQTDQSDDPNHQKEQTEEKKPQNKPPEIDRPLGPGETALPTLSDGKGAGPDGLDRHTDR